MDLFWFPRWNYTLRLLLTKRFWSQQESQKILQKTPHLPFHQDFTGSNPIITPQRCLRSLFHIRHNGCFRKCRPASRPLGDKRCHPKPLAFPSTSQNSAKKFFLGGKNVEFTPTTMTVTKCTRIACWYTWHSGHWLFPNYLGFCFFVGTHVSPSPAFCRLTAGGGGGGVPSSSAPLEEEECRTKCTTRSGEKEQTYILSIRRRYNPSNVKFFTHIFRLWWWWCVPSLSSSQVEKEEGGVNPPLLTSQLFEYRTEYPHTSWN